MKFRIKWLSALIVAVLSCCALTACGGDDDEPEQLGDISPFVGCWKGYDPQSIFLLIRSDYTAKFVVSDDSQSDKYLYSFEGSIAGPSDDGSWEFYGTDGSGLSEIFWYLPEMDALRNWHDAYLHRCSASEIPTEPANSGGSSGSGGNSGGSSGSSGSGQGGSQSNILDILKEHIVWSWSKGTFDNGSFTFFSTNQIQFITVGKSKVGSYGVPTLCATGTYTLSGNTLTATYSSVSVDPSLTSAQMSSHFPGWSVGSSKTVRYTIKSIDDSGLTLTDGSKTWYLDPLY